MGLNGLRCSWSRSRAVPTSSTSRGISRSTTGSPDRLAVVARGIGRHVVRFVEYDGRFYALKELPHEIAHREYRLCARSTRKGCRRSRPSGSSHRPELEDVLITRYLEFSLPYRLVLARKPVADVRARLLDALAELLVRLHLAGFFWGDCSLSNTLFRRDAGSLVAYRSTSRPASITTSWAPACASTTWRSRRRTSPASCSTSRRRSASSGPRRSGRARRGRPARVRAALGELTAEEEFTVSDSSLLADRLRA